MTSRAKRAVLLLYVILQHIWFYITVVPFFLTTLRLYYLVARPGFYKNLSYGSKGHRKVDIYPTSGNKNEEPLPVVLFLYGGAWGSGDKLFYAKLGQVLSKEGVVVAIPNYVLYPHGHVEDMVEDVSCCLQWVVENIHQFNYFLLSSY